MHIKHKEPSSELYKNGFKLLRFNSFGLDDILKDILKARLK